MIPVACLSFQDPIWCNPMQVYYYRRKWMYHYVCIMITEVALFEVHVSMYHCYHGSACMVYSAIECIKIYN